jgi:hypothetical protein
MLRAITWCAKCLFLYLLVAIAALRYSWVVTTPVWQIATRMHWTQLSLAAFALSYFLPIYTVTGFLLGLVPFGNLARAIRDLFASISARPSSQFALEPDPVPPVLWAWLPVTLAFLIRFATWQSQDSSILDSQRSGGRVERFFGTLNSQAPALLDSRWISDRFFFTAPMLFLMACALAALLRYRLGQYGKLNPEQQGR